MGVSVAPMSLTSQSFGAVMLVSTEQTDHIVPRMEGSVAFRKNPHVAGMRETFEFKDCGGLRIRACESTAINFSEE
jgi:hypothetical protein